MSIVLLNNNTPYAVLHGGQQDVVLREIGGYFGQYYTSSSFPGLVGTWSQSGGEWFAEMAKPWDDIGPVPGYGSGARYSREKSSIVPVTLYETTEISFQYKTTFGPQHADEYLGVPVNAGGVFLFHVSKADAGAKLGEDEAISNMVYAGGWHDWTEFSISLSAGNYFLFFSCAHVFLRDDPRDGSRVDTYPDLQWGNLPEGETPTYQARVKDFVLSPGNVPFGATCEARSVGGTSLSPHTINDASATIWLPQFTIASGVSDAVDTAEATLAAQQPGIYGAVAVPVANVSTSLNNIAYNWSMIPTRASQAKLIYTCTLGDLEIPISSFTAILRNGTQSYLNAVVPNITAYESGINARSDEEIVIYKGYEYSDGTRNLEAIVKSNFESLRVDQGGIQASGTMVGYRQKTYTNGVEREIQNVQYRQIGANGNLRLRGEIDLFLKPGDICMYGENSFIVDYVTYYVSPSLAYMEVSE